MKLFKRKMEERAQPEKVSESDTIGAELLRALLGNSDITREQALEIPVVNAAIDKISKTIVSLPIKLYQKKGEETKEITDDVRLKLLNNDTGDTLTSSQFWYAMLADYYLGKGGFAYINKFYTEFKGLHYIENEYIGFMTNVDPIYKDYDILVNGEVYSKYSFLKLLRKTPDGHRSVSLQSENKIILSTAYHTLKLEENLVKKGGNKKGFLTSEREMTRDAKEYLKEAFKQMYSNNTENVVVLNKGMEFKESSNSCVEMQLNENKAFNSAEIAMLFGIPICILKGNTNQSGTSQKDVDNFIDNCIVPLITEIESSLDRDLLTEEEKENGFFFAYDVRELKRGNIKERYEAYEIGYRNNFLQVDEIRQMEDLKPIGFKFIKLGLDSVLYNPETGEIYTPNTNETTNMTLTKGNEVKKDESGIKS